MSKQDVADVTAKNLGLRLFRLPAGHLPSQSSELESLARLWQRESYLLPFALYMDGVEENEDSATPGFATFCLPF